ncbi:MAG: MBL fold metallo-hydrolase [Candidatus Omnitrophota bacterium]
MVVRGFVIGPLGTNCYVVHDKRSLKGVLIDPGVYDQAISDYIRDRSINIIYTLNTHGHADHIFGNAAFGYPVLMHSLDKSDVDPARLLEDGDIVEVGDIKLEIIHTPGHTPGSVSIKLDYLLFSGDALFFEGVGRTDIPGGDHDTLMRSIKEKLMVLPGSVVVFPGHGPQTTIEHERRSNPLLHLA